MLVRMGKKRNTPPLLLGLHPGTTTLVISLDILLKIVNSSSWKQSYTTFEHISKICPTIPQGYLLHYAHRALLVIARSWTTQMSLNKEWIQKIWFITQWHTTPLLRIRTSWVFSGKWIELDNIILSEVTQKDMHIMSSLVTGYTSKSKEYLGYYLQKFRSLTTKIPSEDTSIPLKRVMKIIMWKRGRE